MRFGIVGGGFAYQADLLAWSSRPIRLRAGYALNNVVYGVLLKLVDRLPFRLVDS